MYLYIYVYVHTYIPPAHNLHRDLPALHVRIASVPQARAGETAVVGKVCRLPLRPTSAHWAADRPVALEAVAAHDSCCNAL